jgi:DNA (cytosine-5)-methyltransferase 1
VTRVLDLFCGAGGFSHGFERAGFQIVAGVDNDRDAVATFQLNHPKSAAIEADISKLSPHALGSFLGIYPGDIEVIIGGPPCQGFSRNRAFRFMDEGFQDDERNELYWHFYDFIDYFKPEIVVMENVPEMLSAKNGHFRDNIEFRLENFGYTTNMHIIYANDFGVPQYRKRAFIIASQRNKIKFPQPVYGRGVRVGDRTPNSKKTQAKINGLFDLPMGPDVWDAIGDIYGEYAGSLQGRTTYATDPMNDYQRMLRGENKMVGNHFEWKLSENQLRRIRLLKEGQGMEHLPIEMQTRGGYGSAYRRMHSDAQALTLTTWLFHPGSGMFTHPRADRVITIREAARLQSFNDNFEFTGSYHSQCRQVGNSVAPLVAESIGRSLLEQSQTLSQVSPFLSI